MRLTYGNLSRFCTRTTEPHCLHWGFSICKAVLYKNHLVHVFGVIHLRLQMVLGLEPKRHSCPLSKSIPQSPSSSWGAHPASTIASSVHLAVSSLPSDILTSRPHKLLTSSACAAVDQLTLNCFDQSYLHCFIQHQSSAVPSHLTLLRLAVISTA